MECVSIGPCPKCKSYGTIELRYRLLSRHRYTLVCNKCLKIKATGKSFEIAARNWNTLGREAA